MATTDLEIDFHLKGPNIDPDRITQQSGVQPTRTFRVGEARHPSLPINKLAGWEWRCSSFKDNDEALWSELLAALLPAVDAFKEALKEDPEARASIDIFGTITQDLLTDVQGLKKHRYIISDGTKKNPYDKSEISVINDLPMLEGENVGLSITPEALRFMADINATFETDISILIDENQSWNELREKLAKERNG